MRFLRIAVVVVVVVVVLPAVGTGSMDPGVERGVEMAYERRRSDLGVRGEEAVVGSV